MRICITSKGDSLDSLVDPRFGRCQYFIIVDGGCEDFEAVKNPNVNSASGAGIQSGQLISDKKVEVVLTGNIGPKAFQVLQAAGIDVITGVSGSIKEAMTGYKNGEYKPKQGPSVDSHFGAK